MHARFLPLDACGLQKGRREVDKTDVVTDLAARGCDPFFPHDGHWDMVGMLILIAFNPGEWHAMIGSKHNQGIVQLPCVFQRFEDALNVAIHVLNLIGIVQHIIAYGIGIWPVSRYFCDGIGFFAVFCTYTIFIGAVGFVEANPKTPGLVLRSPLEESSKISCVIVVGNFSGGSCGFECSKLRTQEFSFSTVFVKGFTWCIALPGKARAITIGGQYFRVGFESGREINPVVASCV